MRILVFTLILISFFKLPARAQGVDHGVREKVLSANDEAIRIMRTYSENSNNNFEYRKAAKRMANLLEKSAIAPADNMTMQRRIKNPMLQAVTGLNTHLVSLCPYALQSNKNELIQIFIHESYHLYEGDYYYRMYNPELYKKFLTNNFYMTSAEADDSERRASIIELQIMLKTYGCVFSTSSYFKRLLGLEKNKDYFICK
jgi:hypothetical protein